MGDIAIKIEGISKRYTIGKKKDGNLSGALISLFKSSSITEEEEFWALKNVSFEVKKGEAIGIIGKNGAGKSTLLKVLSKITKPTKGRIEIDGRVASLLEVGTGFHPELTGRENIYLNGTLLGMSRKEVKAKFDEIIDFSGIKKFIDTPVKHYSSGMYVRLAFAVAAHLEPEILIIDEVLAVGDVEFQQKCLGKMQDVAKKGRTVIFVSHDMNAFKSLCERGFVLNNGSCVFKGIPKDAINYYLGKQKKSVKHFLKFENLGNEFVQVNSIRINKEKEQITPSDDINVLVEFVLLECATKRVDISISIYNENEQLITTVGSAFFEKEYVTNTQNSRQVILLSILNPNLNTGLYSITLRFIENRASRANIRIDEIITFEVTSKNNRGIFVRKEGIITPNIKILSKNDYYG